MLKTTLYVVATLSMGAGALVAQRGTAPPTEVTHVTESSLTSRVKADIGATPDLSLTEVKNTTDYLINVVHRGKPGNAITHVAYHELHYITEGGGVLVTGGKLVQSPGGGTIIEGGESRRVHKGDAVVIPKNTPHWYKEVDGTIVYLEGRFRAPTPQE